MITRKSILIFALVWPVLSNWAFGEERSLESLRQDVAMHYLQPEPHVRLAKYYYDHHNRIAAFYILEYVRRERFPAEQFGKAFDQIFLKSEPFDNSKRAETVLLMKYEGAPNVVEVATKLAKIYISRDDWAHAKVYLRECVKLEPENFTHLSVLGEVLNREGNTQEAEKLINDYVARHPGSKDAYGVKIDKMMGEKWSSGKLGGKRDPALVRSAHQLLEEAVRAYPNEGTFAFNYSVVLEEEGKWDEAEKFTEKAAALSKDSDDIQGWTGRFFLKVKKDNAKALEYYLNAYFLNTDFYDSEYAESRITKLNDQLVQSKFEDMLHNGTRLEKMLSDDNPLMVSDAIEEMEKDWKPGYIGPLVDVMTHDDEAVRGPAAAVIWSHADHSFDDQLTMLLKDPDLRRRGLAGYIAVKLWGKKGIEAVKPWLKDDAQLARYDALSALLQFGGDEGRKVVSEEAKIESDPMVKAWVQNLLTAPPRK